MGLELEFSLWDRYSDSVGCISFVLTEGTEGRPLKLDDGSQAVLGIDSSNRRRLITELASFRRLPASTFGARACVDD